MSFYRNDISLRLAWLKSKYKDLFEQSQSRSQSQSQSQSLRNPYPVSDSH